MKRNNFCFPQGDDADATDERKKARQHDENDYDEAESGDERKDASDVDSDDDFDVTNVKLEVDEEFDISRLKMEVQRGNEDVEQLDEIERKEDEYLDEEKGDEDILNSINNRSSGYSHVKNFIYDKEKHRWCTIKFEMPIKSKSIDMTNVLREAAKASTIWQVPRIKRAFAHKQNDVLIITTDGINIGVSLPMKIVVLATNHLLT